MFYNIYSHRFKIKKQPSENPAAEFHENTLSLYSCSIIICGDDVLRGVLLRDGGDGEIRRYR